MCKSDYTILHLIHRLLFISGEAIVTERRSAKQSRATGDGVITKSQRLRTPFLNRTFKYQFAERSWSASSSENYARNWRAVETRRSQTEKSLSFIGLFVQKHGLNLWIPNSRCTPLIRVNGGLLQKKNLGERLVFRTCDNYFVRF